MKKNPLERIDLALRDALNDASIAALKSVRISMPNDRPGTLEIWSLEAEDKFFSVSVNISELVADLACSRENAEGWLKAFEDAARDIKHRLIDMDPDAGE
jgi:hypothetical protein